MVEFLIFLLIIALLWPLLMKWFRSFMAHRAEDFIRKMTGQPSRREERKQRRAEERKADTTSSGYRRPRRFRHPADHLKKVAEDVDYSESVDYSEPTSLDNDTKREQRIYREEQIEDVKYTEVKEK